MASDACSRISHFSDRLSGMPISWNPTVTLLQKKRAGLLNCTGPLELEMDENELHKKSNGTKVGSDDLPDDLPCHATDEGNLEEEEDVKDKQTTDRCSITNDEKQAVLTVSERHATTSKDRKQNSENSSRDAEREKKKKTKKVDKSWSPPHASYRLKRYQNQPMKIENYEPGMSSLVLLDPFVNNFYNPPVEKPGEFCKYVEQRPEVRYEIRKTNGALSPSVSEKGAHDVYRQVQKGGDIPLAGLRYPIPPVKSHTYHRLKKDQIKLVHSQSSHCQSYSHNNQSTYNENLPASADSSLSWSSSLQNKMDRPHSSSAYSSCNSTQSRRTRDELSAARKRELEIAIAEARRKRLIEEAENNRARRHSDYFQPHGKSPVALNRYDIDDVMLHAESLPTSPLSPSLCNRHHLVKGRALYTFKAQTNRELSLNKGDTVYILRQIDKNWFEGQRHGSVGIFPVNFVEVFEICQEQSCGNRQKLAVAKFDFEAEYPAELSFQKGDILRLIQVVDTNWYEASLGGRSGLVPKSYVEALNDQLYVPLTLPLTTSTSFTDSPLHISDSPGTMSSTSSCLSSGQDPPLLSASEGHQSHHHHLLRCPDWNASQSVSSKANSHHTQLDGTSSSSTHHKSLRQQQQQQQQQQHPVAIKAFRGRSNSLGAMDTMSREAKAANQSAAEMPELSHRQTEISNSDDNNVDFQELEFVENRSSVAPELAGAYFYVPECRYGGRSQIDSTDILPYMLCQSTFAYIPRDEDELELLPGDIIYVTETFDDGWYVGISQRTNTYGTFPGNYVQRLHLRHIDPSYTL